MSGEAPGPEQAQNEREKYGAAADFDRSTLGHKCSRCGATAPFVVKSTQVKPVEDGPPWLCALDESPGPFVGILCAACLAALKAWMHGLGRETS
jgi:hypothetical protein